ncbi:MAG: DUF2933 domain-containing protein [Burkholderiaceae bacterium]|nr:MAG: DUF2933 domain-containing protein [Burkholderiaceae bacterium]TBR76389.1 MAG: DUF2933 domain-containing protein [Burkholderiaceae bacterium]
MKCDSKMMVKTAAGLGLALAAAYFALPTAHAFIVASAPFLVTLICPVAMLLMMKGMNENKKGESAQPGESKPESGDQGGIWTEITKEGVPHE